MFETSEEICRFVKQAMSQTCPQYHPEENINKEGCKLGVGYFVFFEETCHDIGGTDKADAPKHTIPSYGKKA
jgi:hypothetical protein